MDFHRILTHNLNVIGMNALVTYDAENRPVTITDRARHVTATEYWPTRRGGQVKKRIGPNGNFMAYEYDIEGRVTKVSASVADLNSLQAEPTCIPNGRHPL